MNKAIAVSRLEEARDELKRIANDFKNGDVDKTKQQQRCNDIRRLADELDRVARGIANG
jgi:HAMP domain-containing protein